MKKMRKYWKTGWIDYEFKDSSTGEWFTSTRFTLLGFILIEKNKVFKIIDLEERLKQERN